VALLYLLIAGAIGAGTTVQTGVNARLAEAVGSVRAAFVSVAGSIVLISVIALVGLAFRPLPAGERLADLPWWVWTGGAFGVAFLVVAVVVAPHVGAATLIAAVVAGQALAAVVVDQWGLVGFAQRELSAGRAVGMALVIAGVVLVRAL
jgi:transporter family-2 protein